MYTDTDLNGVADIGGLVTSATTSSSGYYTIPDIPAGSYVIIELQPADYTSVKDIDVSNDGDAVPNTNIVNDTIPSHSSTGRQMKAITLSEFNL